MTTDKKILVVTGGIGSGKSLVSRLLVERGVPVYDSDSKVKALYEAHPEIKALVTEEIFTDRKALDTLERALYPVLMDDFNKWAEAQNVDIVAFESALVLQKPFFSSFGDYVLWVDAPLETRVKRVLARGGISEESLAQRLALQKDCSKDKRVTAVMDNSSDVDNIERKLDKFILWLTKNSN